MELRHLRYFIAVAEERHFGRAARALHIAQPPLSRQIQALEAEIGFALFDRSRRKVELTPGGGALLEHARRVLQALDFGVREARRAANGETGHIAIGYPSSVAFSGLPELILAFRARSPGVEVALRELSPKEQIDALKGGVIDVGFLRGPVDEPEVASRVVRREPLFAALPAQHRLAGRSRVALAELAREPFVSFPRSRGPAFYDSLMRLCHAAGFAPHVVQEAPQLDLVSLVAAGFGVALMPGSVRNQRRPGVVFLPVEGAPVTELCVAWREVDGSPVVRDFLEVLREVGIEDKGAKQRAPAPRRARSRKGAVDSPRAPR
jgi:DNA-binding transcriptional LysR family regulator